MQYALKSCYIKDFGKYDTAFLSAHKSTLNICLVLRDDDFQKIPILLRNTMTAQVYLGCIVDSSNQIYDWLEIWIQETQPLLYDCDKDNNPYNITNLNLDQEWLKTIDQLAQIPNSDLIHTGWEKSHPMPGFLDRQQQCLSALTDRQTGQSWQLCTDDVLLKNHNLPLYSTSIHRYLHIPSQSDNPRFIVVSDSSPKNDSTTLLKDFLKDYPDLLPLNPAAGFMLIRKYCPLDLESLIDIFSNSTASQVSSKLPAGDLLSGLNSLSGQSCDFRRLFCDTRNVFSKTAETFYLKLQFFTDMISIIYRFVQASQKPLFNLCPASWQADITSVPTHLPVLWTIRPVLVDPGTSIYLKIPETDHGYYISSMNRCELSIYRPASISQKTAGHASVLIRQLNSDTDSYLTADGTFSCDERLQLSSNDLVRLRLNLSPQQMDFHALLEKDPSLTPGQWRFRTLSQQFSAEQKTLLQNATGVHLNGIPFQVIPCLSTPCDLYSMAILGIRLFMVNTANSLPIALDELLSLARSISSQSNVPLCKSIETIFKTDSRWEAVLGSSRLANPTDTTNPDAGSLPSILWYELLSVLITMIPGTAAGSICKHYGDVPPGRLHAVFERPLEQLESLLRRTRSLIFHDWKANQQINKIIHDFGI